MKESLYTRQDNGDVFVGTSPSLSTDDEIIIKSENTLELLQTVLCAIRQDCSPEKNDLARTIFRSWMP